MTASPRFDVAVSLHRITGPYSGDDLWLTERRQLARLSSILGLWFIKASLMFQVIIYNVLRALRYEKWKKRIVLFLVLMGNRVKSGAANHLHYLSYPPHL